MYRQNNSPQQSALLLLCFIIFILLLRVHTLQPLLVFIFTNFYIIVGLLCLWLWYALIQMVRNAKRMTNQSIRDALFIPIPAHAPVYTSIKFALFNSAIAFFITLVISSVPLLLVEVTLVFHHSPYQNILTYVLFFLFFWLQLYAGYFSFSNMGRRAWLYGLSTFLVYTFGFGIVIMFFPCHTLRCSRNSVEVFISFLQNPFQTYGMLMVIGAVLGVGPLLGSIFTSLFPPLQNRK